jgi:hypothetical protein
MRQSISDKFVVLLAKLETKHREMITAASFGDQLVEQMPFSGFSFPIDANLADDLAQDTEKSGVHC